MSNRLWAFERTTLTTKRVSASSITSSRCLHTYSILLASLSTLSVSSHYLSCVVTLILGVIKSLPHTLSLSLCLRRHGQDHQLRTILKHLDTMDTREQAKARDEKLIALLESLTNLAVDRKNTPDPRPWPTESVQKLKADVSNYRDWRLCLEAVATGQQPLHLLDNPPQTESPINFARESQLKSFIILTIHESHRQAVSSRESHEAIAYLASIAPQSNLNLVDRVSRVKPPHRVQVYCRIRFRPP